MPRAPHLVPRSPLEMTPDPVSARRPRFRPTVGSDFTSSGTDANGASVRFKYKSPDDCLTASDEGVRAFRSQRGSDQGEKLLPHSSWFFC